MNRAIELHDSELASFELREGVAVVCLRPVYLHESEGRPGFDAGTGWTADVDLRIFGASVPKIDIPPELPALLWGGRCAIGAVLHENVIPLPFPLDVPLELTLSIALLSSIIVIHGSRAVVELLGEPQYVEQFVPG